MKRKLKKLLNICEGIEYLKHMRGCQPQRRAKMTNTEATKANIAAICDRLADEEITLAQASEETGWPLFTDDGTDENSVLVPLPNVTHADDGNAELMYPDTTAEDAANEYIESGDWGDRDETQWIKVYTWIEGIDAKGEIVRINDESYLITLDPIEPDCDGDQEHDWQSPYEIVGGIKENPGVWGHGGGVTITEVCIHCGCERFTDTWAQNPETGEQGLTSVAYTEGKYADEVSAESDETEEE
jgi:hypothetical protein